MSRRVTLFVFLMSFFQLCYSQINIWDGTNNKRVNLTPYIVPGKHNVAIIVCPGGSYFWHDMQTEGVEVAHWLNDMGISAFVLRYRTAYVPAFITRFRYLFRGNRYPDPQHDLIRSIEYIRENAEKLGVDTHKLGVMGFSAGGHLVMSVAESVHVPEILRPNFVASIYPVVTMSASCTHKRSRRALLGDNKKNNKILQDSLSIEKHVTHACPPVFIVNCKDDPVVNYHNSELLDSALTAYNIPHKYIQYKTGGHGFGASDSKGSSESKQWKNEFIKWLNIMKVL